MQKQVVVINGGSTFDTYEEYLSSLKNKEVSIEKFKTRKDWKGSLEETLGPDFEVLTPRMPNSGNARYEEWKIWFERMVPFLHDDLVLVGHSLGGIFVTKYLSENVLPKNIQAVVLVAAPFNDDEANFDESLGDFGLPASLETFASQTRKIYLFQSKDDPVVPFGEVEKYKKALPNAEVILFDDRQHFNQEFFPELIELLKSI